MSYPKESDNAVISDINNLQFQIQSRSKAYEEHRYMNDKRIKSKAWYRPRQKS